jgi:hypothetical protein
VKGIHVGGGRNYPYTPGGVYQECTSMGCTFRPAAPFHESVESTHALLYRPGRLKSPGDGRFPAGELTRRPPCFCHERDGWRRGSPLTYRTPQVTL